MIFIGGRAVNWELFQVQADTDPTIEYYKPNGPLKISLEHDFRRRKLFGEWRHGHLNMRSAKVMIYENNFWKVIEETQIKPSTGRSALDFMNVAVHPQDINISL